jgi:hypothetical protein
MFGMPNSHHDVSPTPKLARAWSEITQRADHVQVAV